MCCFCVLSTMVRVRILYYLMSKYFSMFFSCIRLLILKGRRHVLNCFFFSFIFLLLNLFKSRKIYELTAEKQECLSVCVVNELMKWIPDGFLSHGWQVFLKYLRTVLWSAMLAYIVKNLEYGSSLMVTCGGFKVF